VSVSLLPALIISCHTSSEHSWDYHNWSVHWWLFLCE